MSNSPEVGKGDGGGEEEYDPEDFSWLDELPDPDGILAEINRITESDEEFQARLREPKPTPEEIAAKEASDAAAAEEMFDENGNLLPDPETEAAADRLEPFLADDGTWSFGDQPDLETMPGFYLDTMSRYIRLRRGVIDFQGWLEETYGRREAGNTDVPPSDSGA